MNYLFADIKIQPYSADNCDILCAVLGDEEYDSFEITDTGVKAYIQADKFDNDSLSRLLNDFVIPGVTFEYSVNELENKDWNEEWEKTSFTPVLEEQFGIKLCPKMAFGSGSHDTTYMLTEYLMKKDLTGKRVLDMGCGTGVLGIAMSKRGAGELVSIDIDEMSVQNTKENLLLNGIDDAEVILGDATKIQGSFDVIVANIHKNILINDMSAYESHLAQGGILIMSGFFADDVSDIQDAAKLYGMSVIDILNRNEWTALVVCK